MKKYRGGILRDTEQWYKIWINLDFVVSQLLWGIRRNASARKRQRNYVAMILKVDAKLRRKLTCGVKNDKQFG